MKTEKEIREMLKDEEEKRDWAAKINLDIPELMLTRGIRALKWVLSD